MKRVNLKAPLTINVTGYDQEATTYAAGEQDVPDRVADWVRRNAQAGAVMDLPQQAARTSSGPPAAAPSGSQQNDEDLVALTVLVLRERAAAAGIDASGLKKAELVAALEAASASGASNDDTGEADQGDEG